MKRWTLALATALSLAGATGLRAVNTKASLLLPVETARPGETVLAGVRLQMNQGWHTYWRNAGGSGMPTEVQWTLPAGITAGEILWPVPEKFVPEGPDSMDLTTYVYHDEVVLLVPLTIASNTPHGPVRIEALVEWLECDVQCIPGDQKVSASLTIGNEPRPSPDADRIRRAVSALPETSTDFKLDASWEGPGTKDGRPLRIQWEAPGAQTPDFFPYASPGFEVLPATERISGDSSQVQLRKTVRRLEGNWPTSVSGLAIWTRDGKRTAREVILDLTGQATDDAQSTTLAAPGALPSAWKMLFYAFLGGMILNVMPCVLPVISLKILGFVSEADSHPRHVRFLGLVYAAGVLVSFLVLAALVIGLKAAGKQAGWGMQFSNPQFIVVLTILVTAIALSLFGVFEINLNGRLMGAVGTLSARQGAGGAFFNGVLATVLATPCTAPILGAALGFAFVQPPPVIVGFFLTVGLGLAFPYLLLSWHPAWLRHLPRPGVWMEKFKIAMGFPMLATAVWLFHLLPTFYGKRVLWMGMFLVLLALAGWMFGEFVQRGRAQRGVAGVLAGFVLIGGFAYAIEGKLAWREPLDANGAPGMVARNPAGVAWKPWSREAVAQAREQGRPVLVDFTAEWCLTCNLNVKPVLESAPVRKKLAEIGAVAFLADYTRTPPVMTEELRRYHRAGVPLVLVYPADRSRPAMVLPEAITTGIVLEALNKAVP